MAAPVRRMVLALAAVALALCGAASSSASDAEPVLESLARESECSGDSAKEGACSASWLQRRSAKLAGRSGAAQGRGEARVAGLGGATSGASRHSQRRYAGTSEQSANTSEEVSRFCDTHTGGTCRFTKCDASRGPTQCVNHECRCLPGNCALYGSCRKAQAGDVSCPKSTGGSCKLFRCGAYRGPTECVQGECLCQEGFCSSDDGTCHRHNGVFKANVVQVNSESPRFPGRHGRVRSALCFSGGGSRSLSLTLGALRALESLKLMGHVDAISSVSGGSWASAIYTFAKMDAEELLGTPTDPSELSMYRLARTPPPLGDVVRTNVIQVAEGLFESTNYNELWIKTMAQALLQPFDLGSDKTYMAPDAESVEDIVRRNPQLKAEQFVTPQQGRPRTLVMGGTLLAPDGHKGSDNNAVSLQMSPDWTGSPFYPNEAKVSYTSIMSGSSRGRNAPLTDLVVGGGLVETFAFGGQAPANQSGGKGLSMEAPPLPWSLASAVGVSSAAFATLMSQIPLFSDTASRLVPKGNYWPVMSQRFPGTQAAMRYQLGDGGNLENSGVLPMLQRGARRIAWFVNTDTGISQSFDFCGAHHIVPGFNFKGLITNQVTDKFGFGHSSRSSFLNNNQVFEATEFFPLVCELQKKRDAGKPAVSLRNLTVTPNRWWGITGGFKVEVLVVYNDRCTDFESKLPLDTQQELRSGDQFRHFPWFKTVMQNRGRFTSYTSEQVNLLSSQSEYAVRENAEFFRGILS